MPQKPFSERCYRVLKRVPRGRVTTYKEIAKSLGTQAYRAVGSAMNRNPYAPVVPCHRVVKSTGEIGGFAGGTKQKAALLRKEGVAVKNGKVVDFRRRFFTLS